MSDEPRTPEQLADLKARLIQQTCDLVNKARVPPGLVADLMINTASALCLSLGTPPAELAGAFRNHAAALDRLKIEEDRPNWN